MALALGWSEAEIQASFDRVVDDIYVSENWDQLAARGVDYFSLLGSHDWVAYDVPGTASIPLEPGRTSIDLITAHTVTVGGNVMLISAPYTRVALD